MVTDEEERPRIRKVKLHPDQACHRHHNQPLRSNVLAGKDQLTVGMPRQMMQRDPLAEVHSPLIECLPVQPQLQVVLQVHANVRARRHGHKRGGQLPMMNPDLDVLAVQEHVQPARVVEMQMSDNTATLYQPPLPQQNNPTDIHLLNILQLMPRSLNLRLQLMLLLIPHPRKYIRHLRSPHSRIVLPAPRLP